MKKETRGRPQKKHQPIKMDFSKVLETLADSEYVDEKKLKAKKQK